VYSVEWEQGAQVQAAALPREALSPLAELMALLEIAPWSGDPYRTQADPGMLTPVFGKRAEGLAIYLILEDQRRVVVVRVVWAA
jgi:hypothetical protein